MTTPDNTYESHDSAPQRQAPRSYLVERDVDAIEALLDDWIAATGPDVDIPLLGTPDWVAADDTTQRAAVAVFVLGCLVERDPIVIAARLVAETAILRASRMAAARQASHAISAGADWTALAQRLVQRDRIARHDRLRR